MTDYQFSEAKLARHLGLQRKDLKHLRNKRLKKERDWGLHGPRVAYNTAGVARLLRAMKMKPKGFDLSACQCGGGNGKEAVIELGTTLKAIPVQVRIVRVCANPGLIQGFDQHQQLINIWVGRNENFMVGMSVPVVPNLDRPGMYRLDCVAPQRRYSIDEWTRRQAAGMRG